MYGWAMSQKLPVDSFKWKTNMSTFDEESIKDYDEDSKKGYILEKDAEHPKRLHDFHSDLPFLAEKKQLSCSHKKLGSKSWISFEKTA